VGSPEPGQRRDFVALGDHVDDRRLQVRESWARARGILFEVLATRALSGQMVIVIRCNDLVEHRRLTTFDGVDEAANQGLIRFDQLSIGPSL
jgi:hypothetical protein